VTTPDPVGEHRIWTYPNSGRVVEWDALPWPDRLAHLAEQPDLSWDGNYVRDEKGRRLTTCSETGRPDYVICGHPIHGGTFCGFEGRQDDCPSHMPLPVRRARGLVRR